MPRPRSYAQVVAFANRTLPLYTAALRKLGTSDAVNRLQEAALASRGAASDLGVTACAAG